MRRSVYFLVPVLAMTLSTMAYAQGGKPITLSGDRAETVRATVTGGLDFDWVFRSAGLMEAQGQGPSSWTTIEGGMQLRLDIELTNKVNVAIDLSSTKNNGTSAPARWGAAPNEIDMGVREATITLKDFLQEGLTIEAGVVPYRFNIRGGSGSPVFDPRWSNNYSSTPANSYTGLKDELQPTGAIIHLDREALQLDFILLPAIVEGGASGNDDAAFGVAGFYELSQFGEGSRAGALILSLTDKGNDRNTFTIGGGVDIHNLADQPLEVFAEIYLQFGDAATSVDAEGMLVELGAKYMLEGEQNPWAELKITRYTGDDASASANSAFNAYQNQGDLLIIESQSHGINLRTNYMAIKISGGLQLSYGGTPNNIDLSATLGIGSLVEDVSGTSKLGNELDIRGTYHVSGQTDVNVDLGYLFGSEVLELAPGPKEDSATVFSIGVNIKY